MPIKESTRANYDQKRTPEFRPPAAWVGRSPRCDIKICFAATNVDGWETGASALVNWQGKKFRIICDGKEEAAETTRGILVGE